MPNPHSIDINSQLANGGHANGRNQYNRKVSAKIVIKAKSETVRKNREELKLTSRNNRFLNDRCERSFESNRLAGLAVRFGWSGGRLMGEFHIELFNDGLGMKSADIVVDSVCPGMCLSECLFRFVLQPVVVAQSLASCDLFVAQMSEARQVGVNLLRCETGAARAEELSIALVRAFGVAAVPCVTWERSLEPPVN